MKHSVKFENVFIIFVIFLLNHGYAEEKDIDEGSKAEVPADRKVNEDLAVLLDDAKDYAHHVGMKMRTKDMVNRSDVAEFAPFALFPTPFPRKIFKQAMDVQEPMMELYFRVSNDFDFLAEHLREVSKSDETIRTLIEIMREAREEDGPKQPICMIWARSDYMCHENMNANEDTPKYELKQIEMNIGAAGGYIGERTTQVHRRVLEKAAMDVSNEVVPDNSSSMTTAQGLYEAWKLFGNPDAVVAFYMPRNGIKTHFVDRAVEYVLRELSKKKVKTIFVDVVECRNNRLTVDPVDKSLRFDGQLIGVFFYRVTLLLPLDTMPKGVMDVRRTVERSTAIKCPTVGMILASTKKIQQVLAMPNMVERFFPLPEDADTVEAIRKTFTGMWALDKDDDTTKAVIKDAMEHPERYVLKPNREGGGHNFWNEQIPEKLKNFSKSELAEHILMQRIQPRIAQNYFVRPHEAVEFGDVVTELSPFGVLVGNMDKNKVIFTRSHGHFARTKWSDVTEGGIRIGSAVYDSPYLFDTD